MAFRGLVMVCALAPALAACAGDDSGGDDAAGDDSGDDQPAGGSEIRATVTFGDGRVVELVAEVSFNLSARYCSCGGSMDGLSMSYAWSVDRADVPGDYEFDTTGLLSMTWEGSRYSGSEGTFTLTTIAEGEIEGTFAATDVSLGSYPQGMRPPDEMQIASVSGGTLRCEGRSDGVYGGCWR